MTTEEAALTGTALTQLVAERLMGWREVRQVGSSGMCLGRHARWNDARTEIPGYGTLVPASDLVADEMVRRHFRFTLTREQTPTDAGTVVQHEVTFTLCKKGKVDESVSTTVRHEDQAPAICKAALLALARFPVNSQASRP